MIGAHRTLVAIACVAAGFAGGCTGVRTYEVMPEQFQTVYDAPRCVVMKHGEYAGIKGQQHRIYVFDMGIESWSAHRCTFVTPVAAMSPVFPDRPQRPLTTGPLSESEVQEWVRAWSGLPPRGCETGSSG